MGQRARVETSNGQHQPRRCLCRLPQRCNQNDVTRVRVCVITIMLNLALLGGKDEFKLAL